MTRAFLVAGVAALAISVPAVAKPDRARGGDSPRATAQQGGGGQRAQRAERQQQPRMQQRAFQRQERAQQPQRLERQQQRSAQRVERQQRADRPQRTQRVEQRQQARAAERQQVRQRNVERQQVRQRNVERQQARTANRQQRIERPARIERQQARMAERQQIRQRDFNRQQRAERQFKRDDRVARVQSRMADRQSRFAVNDDFRIRNNNVAAVGFGLGGCPPGLADKGCVPPGQALKANRIANADAFRFSRLAALAADSNARFIAPAQVVSYVGSPLSTLSNAIALRALPNSVSYLYPDTDDYYYRYGGGYFYRVDRDNDLIDYILPALAGGFLPGQYLPSSYMNRPVPNYYGFNSFYPASYGYGYGANSGYGYDNLCNRYANGTVYQVDCATGMIVDVIPLYANGYGVGQYLPSSYSYYNVPSQYRSLYYNTNDYNYWYSPGAIYQVDPSSSLITAVASLLAPGLSIGQPLPAGYGVYNVPMAYRDTYYDTPNAWYRYNNGYIYQVDPTTQLVTAIVASILT